MANLKSMSVDQLLNLRRDLAEELARRTGALQKDLEKLDGLIIGGRKLPKQATSFLKGRKVPIKFRSGKNAWAGRGAKPKWLVAKLKEGKKLQDFAVTRGR